jgi:hypothetical protein
MDLISIASGQSGQAKAFSKVAGENVPLAQVRSQRFRLYEGDGIVFKILLDSGDIAANIVSSTQDLVRYESTWNFTAPVLKPNTEYRIGSTITCAPKTGASNNTRNTFSSAFGLRSAYAQSPLNASISAPQSTSAQVYQKTCNQIRFRVLGATGSAQLIPTSSSPTSRQPTATLFPTNSPAPNQTNIAVYLKLAGIGADRTVENNVIQFPQRNIHIQLISAQNNLTSSPSGIVTYNPQTGLYKGFISLDSNFAGGAYLIKVRTDNTLWRQVPGIQNLTAGTLNETQAATLVSGDLNGDNEISVLDYNIFLSCSGNRICSQKSLADFNNDSLVEEIDLNILLSSFRIREGD